MNEAAVTVVGATSKLGQNLILKLIAAGRRVIPLARRLDALPMDQQATARYFDLEQPETLRTALADAAYVVSCVPAHNAATVVAALPAQTRRIVMMGSTRIFTRYPNRHVEMQKQAVAALAHCGIPGVVLHPTMIYGGPTDANVQRIAAYIRKFGIVPLPAGGLARLQPIHSDDVVACIEASLMQDSALGEPLVVAGPEAITYRDLVTAVGHAIGKTPVVVPLPGLLLQIAALLTAVVPGVPTIRMSEIRRLSENKTFPIDEMRRRLGVDPMPIAAGLARTFAG